MARYQTANMRKIVQEIGKCELCGSKRDLQAHHIIPEVVYECDDRANLVCVCRRCHSVLTPTSLLTKIGQSKYEGRNADDDVKYRIYKKIQQKLGESGGTLNFNDFYDAIDEA